MSSERMLAEEFIRAHPVDAARILEGLGIEEAGSLSGELSPQLAAMVLRYMEPPIAARCIEQMAAARACEVVALLPLENSSMLLRRITGKRRDEILEGMPEDMAGQIRLLLHYPEGTAGALMDPQVFTLPEDITVREALKRIQKLPDHLIYYIFVLSRDHALAGVVDIRQLMQARPDDAIASLEKVPTARLLPHMHRQTILANPGWQAAHVLPVVDDKGAFLGAIDYGTMKRLENDEREAAPGAGADNVATALGELYWVGLSAFLSGAVPAFGKKKD